jgi:hypothetical protein
MIGLAISPDSVFGLYLCFRFNEFHYNAQESTLDTSFTVDNRDTYQ